jgi:hypothetical protein
MHFTLRGDELPGDDLWKGGQARRNPTHCCAAGTAAPQCESAVSRPAAWSQEIVAMWRFTRNNGITEGFHNKMELISRQAYGFRNFENYRLRVKVLCS